MSERLSVEELMMLGGWGGEAGKEIGELQRYATQLEAENERLMGIVEGQDKEDNLPSLRADNARLREEAAWWAGEGQKDRPEIVEWRTLAAKSNPTQEESKRLSDIARKIRSENETAPELLERVSSLEADNARLRERVADLENTSRTASKRIVNQRDDNARLREEILASTTIGTKLCIKITRLREALAEYGMHNCRCIRSQWNGSDPEKGQMFGDKWYSLGDEPPCTCGLDDALEDPDAQ